MAMLPHGRGFLAVLAACVLAIAAAAPGGLAAGGAHADGGQAQESQKGKARARGLRKKLIPKLPANLKKDFQKYCYNISDTARDARIARQKRQLAQMAARIEKLLRELDRKRKIYTQWVLRRREISARMTKSMLDVYAKMEPEAAAAQISQMEYAVAVAILTGLKPQKASAILTEMNPKQAGKLVNVIVGAVAEGAGKTTGETN